jgi:hypothetical protein
MGGFFLTVLGLQLQFVKDRRSHMEAVAEDGSDFYHNEPHVFYSFCFEEHITGMVFRCHVELAEEGGAKKRKKTSGKAQEDGEQQQNQQQAAEDLPPANGQAPGTSSKKKREKPLPVPPGSAKKRKAVDAETAKASALEAVELLEQHVYDLLSEIANARRKIQAIK